MTKESLGQTSVVKIENAGHVEGQRGGKSIKRSFAYRVKRRRMGQQLDFWFGHLDSRVPSRVLCRFDLWGSMLDNL